MEVLDSRNNVTPEFMWSYFTLEHVNINFMNGSMLKLLKTNSACMGINSIIFRTCLLWKIVSQSIKNFDLSIELKTKLKQLGNTDYYCLIFWDRIYNV